MEVENIYHLEVVMKQNNQKKLQEKTKNQSSKNETLMG
jgi:hypothetical protein